MNISHTAAYVAVKFYGLTLDKKIGQHFDKDVLDFYRQMVGFLPKHLSWYQNSLNSPFWRKLFIWSEELLLPGDLMHIVCRKYFIQKQVKDAINSGFEQFVILGSGFDHLGVWLSHSGLNAIELDLNYMASQKQAFIDDAGLNSMHLAIAPFDAESDHLDKILKSVPSFNRNRKTLFIAEGFFDYLNFNPSERILNDIRLLNRNNRILTTHFALNELNLFHRFVFTSGVSLVGESLKFKINKQEFVEFLEEMNFKVDCEIGKKEMVDKLLRPSSIKLPVLSGFYILDASIDG